MFQVDGEVNTCKDIFVFLIIVLTDHDVCFLHRQEHNLPENLQRHFERMFSTWNKEVKVLSVEELMKTRPHFKLRMYAM